jgi:hypothetical protein
MKPSARASRTFANGATITSMTASTMMTLNAILRSLVLIGIAAITTGR